MLEEMEKQILSVENGDSDDGLRRMLHTLKGEAGALGLQDVEKLCHRTEDYLDKAHESVSCDKLLLVKDWLGLKFNACAGQAESPQSVEYVIRALEHTEDDLTASKAAQTISELEQIEILQKTEPDIPLQEQSGGTIPSFQTEIEISSINADATLLTEFIAEATEHLQNSDTYLLQLESSPGDDELINALFRAFHTIKGVAGFLSLGAIQTLAHATESLLDKVRKKEFSLSGHSIDLVFSSVDSLKREIDSLRDGLASGTKYVVHPGLKNLVRDFNEFKPVSAPRESRLGNILIQDGKITRADLEKALSSQGDHPGMKVGELLVEMGLVTSEDIAEALEKQNMARKIVQVKETIKVDTERLDRLVDTIGELVITEAMVTSDETLNKYASATTLRNMRQLDKITRQLQEIGLSMRMLSLRSTFQKMARLTRDLAKKAGKEINFVTSGEDTELDKTVIEKIGDPLVHMVRNSADHGLESPEERRAAGKPETGKITLRAFQKGGNICIEIEDDGKGLDKDAITAKAIKQNMIKAAEKISDQEIYQLIFHPGFSTAKKVTDVSGRGVGMDVVKKSVEALRGNIEIQTQTGKGTTFTIHLPLTMAIMDGMVVRIGAERYIVPTLAIIESFHPRKEDLSSVMNRGELVSSHGELIPLFHLSKLFDIADTVEDPSEGIIVVVEDMGKRTGLLVDSILGQQQTVIKKLGDGIGKVKGISGGAIMSDGCVSLIIDIAGIVRLSGEREIA